MVSGGISERGRGELSRILAGGRRTLTPVDAASALGIDPAAAARRLARWTSNGWLRRVRRGLYVPVPVDVADPDSWSEDPLVLADAVWAPCYFTGWTAANHWALTEQLFRTTVVRTTGRVRRGTQYLLGQEFLVGHVMDEHMTWGVATLWRGDRRLDIADPARVVIDSLDDPAICGGIRHVAEVLETYLMAYPAADLVEYGDRLGNRAVFKRLGYIVERAGLDVDNLAAMCAERVSAGISWLDPTGVDRGHRVSAWGLRINATITGGES